MHERKYIKDYYNKNAHLWVSQKVNSFHHEIPFRKFQRLLKNGDTVLDIGCAGGIHVPLFLGIGRKLRYTGIDISKSMIKIAKSRYPQLPFSIADIATYKPKKKFAAFWAAAVLMHIPENERDEVFSSLEKMLKPGAIGYLSLPAARPNEQTKSDRRQFTLYTKKTFKEFAKKRKWSLLDTGSLASFAGKNIWNWYIVRIP